MHLGSTSLCTSSSSSSCSFPLPCFPPINPTTRPAACYLIILSLHCYFSSYSLSPFHSTIYLSLSLSACVWIAVRSGIFMTLVIKFNCCTFGARAHGASLGCGRGDITLHPPHTHTHCSLPYTPPPLIHCPSMPASRLSKLVPKHASTWPRLQFSLTLLLIPCGHKIN